MSIYYVAGIPYSDELFHHGIKGQKWGIRRYQNPDGTLTAEGKARYGDSINRGSKLIDKHQNKLKQFLKGTFKGTMKGMGAAALADPITREKLAEKGLKVVRDILVKADVIPFHSLVTGSAISAVSTGLAVTSGILAISAGISAYKAGKNIGDLSNVDKFGYVEKDKRKTLKNN